jgi:large subunit ribosomal protein L4
MKLEVFNIQGASTGRTIELADNIFGVAPNEHVMYLAVKQYLAHQRQGTHKSKERREISGSTRKLHRQKGTGGARKGDINSPLFPGGGRVFGPRPRKYTIALNKKVKVLARKSALSAKMGSGSIRVVEDFNLDQPRTKDMVGILSNFNLDQSKTLLVFGEHNNNVYRSIRNLPKASMTTATDLNVYSILNAGTLLLSESAVARIQDTLA